MVRIIAQTAKAYDSQVDEWFDLAVYYFDEKEDAPDVGFSYKLVQPEPISKRPILSNLCVRIKF